MVTWQSPYSFLEIERIGKISLVRFTGKAIVEEKSIRLIGEELIRLVEKFGYRQLLLDFSEVKNLSSYMLATLVNLHKKIRAAGGDFRLCGIDPELRQVFELTRLTKIFSIHPDQTTALQSF